MCVNFHDNYWQELAEYYTRFTCEKNWRQVYILFRSIRRLRFHIFMTAHIIGTG